MRAKRAIALAAALAALVVLAVWRPLASSDGALHEFTGPTMGSTFTVRVDAELSSEDHEAVEDVIVERLAWVNRLASTFDPSSEISRFNAHQSTAPFIVSKELIELLGIAREVSERSGGAFDVTVAPLVEVWGFGPAAEPPASLPDERRLAALLPLVGYEGILLDPAAGTLAKANPAVTVDLSGIAQGWGSDVVAAALEDLGLSSFLVDVGGELRAVGQRRDGSSWRVGVERPDDGPGVFGTVDLADQGIATSGDYRNHFERDGVRYSHIIDPRTAQPIRTRGASVTVVEADAARADAWATALAVLGPDEGYTLAVREGLAALFVTSESGELRSRLTPTMASRFAPADPGP